jgi:hypothetical protein
MRIQASLLTRVKRLEAARGAKRQAGLAERLRLARVRREAMSEGERAAHRCRSIEADIATLSEPDEQPDTMGARIQRAHRRMARMHIEGLRLLSAPDLVEPDPRSGEPHWAWCRRQRLKTSWPPWRPVSDSVGCTRACRATC